MLQRVFRSRALFGLAFLGLAVVLPAIAVTASDTGAGATSDNPNPNAVWVAQSHGVWKFLAEDGSLLLELPASRVRAVATDPLRGTLWAYGRALTSYTPDGEQRTSTRLSLERNAGSARAAGNGPDTGDPEGSGPEDRVRLAVSHGNGAVWVAGDKALVKVDRGGTLRWREPLKRTVEAIALDTERDRLWVAQRGRLIAFAADGSRSVRIDLAGREMPVPQALSYAPDLDALWVAGEDRLLRFGADGRVQYQGRFNGIRRLATDHHGGLWLAGERTLRHLDASGLVRLEVQPFPRFGELADLAANPTDGSVWAASPQGMARVARSGAVAHRRDFRGPEYTGRVRALALFADVTPPELTVQAPEPDSIHATLTPELRFAYRDLGSGVDPETLQATVDGRAVALDCQHRDGTADCLPQTALPEGRLAFAATVTDYAGNTSEPAEAGFILDVTPPTVSVDEPADGAYTNQAEITLRGRVTDNVSGVANLTVAGTAVEVGPGHGFAHTVALPEDGVHRFDLAARDRAGNRATLTRTVIRDTVPPAAPATGKIEVAIEDGTAAVTGGKGSVEAHATVEVTNTRTGDTVTVTADAEGRFRAEIAARRGDKLRIKVIDRAGNESEPAEIATSDVPPDPSEVAPALPATGSPPLAERVAFLYSGPNPIQEGVEPGTIEARRVAVLRGEVRDRSGEPLPGVKITVLNHPELGHTRTRTDGMFDLAVNGGATLTVVYEKEGYLPVQRQVPTQWRDWYWAEDVVMTELSDKVTTIDLTDDSQAFQVARGEVAEDADGQRQATLLFPKGTTAEMTLPDGTTEQLTTLDVRATEYTVGEDGPDAMPGKLPPASAYTYAVELSVDQVRERGKKVAGKGVRFSQPISFYLDNFLDFPVGEIVPVGYYNREGSRWESYENGRIVEIVTEESGRAVLDVTGDGEPATQEELEGLGISQAELARLAEIYDPGKRLWRVALRHLSTWDLNWPWRPPWDAENPDVDLAWLIEGDIPSNTEEETCKRGSKISPQRQAVGESIGIPGTPYALHYRSDRVPGYM